MKRLLVILLLAAIIFWIAWLADQSEPVPQPQASAKMQTRGPVPEPNKEWAATLAQLRQEDARSMPVLMSAWLQAPSGLIINGEVKICSAFITNIAAVAAFAAVRQQMKDHTQDDKRQFEEIKERFTQQATLLTEIRLDIKRMIGEKSE